MTTPLRDSAHDARPPKPRPRRGGSRVEDEPLSMGCCDWHACSRRTESREASLRIAERKWLRSPVEGAWLSSYTGPSPRISGRGYTLRFSLDVRFFYLEAIAATWRGAHPDRPPGGGRAGDMCALGTLHAPRGRWAPGPEPTRTVWSTLTVFPLFLWCCRLRVCAGAALRDRCGLGTRESGVRRCPTVPRCVLGAAHLTR